MAATSKTPERARPVDMSVLSESEIAAIRTEAAQEVEKETKAAARAQMKEKLLLEARRMTGIEEKTETVVIDLAPYCDRALLDNRAYMQGQSYTVPQSVASVLREIMQRTWNHQAEIDGKSENFYRRTRGARVLPNGGVVNTSQLLRA